MRPSRRPYRPLAALPDPVEVVARRDPPARFGGQRRHDVHMLSARHVVADRDPPHPPGDPGLARPVRTIRSVEICAHASSDSARSAVIPRAASAFPLATTR